MTTSLRDRLLALADKAIWAAAAGNATDLQPDDVRMLREAAAALTAPASPPALEGMDETAALRDYFDANLELSAALTTARVAEAIAKRNVAESEILRFRSLGTCEDQPTQRNESTQGDRT